MFDFLKVISTYNPQLDDVLSPLRDLYQPIYDEIGFPVVIERDIYGHLLFIKASRKNFRRNK